MLNQLLNLLRKSNRRPARNRAEIQRALRVESLEGRRLLALFAPEVLYGSGGSFPYNLAVADFNSDGKTDIASANIGGSSVGVLTNSGIGTFSTNVLPSGGPSFYNVATGDFNNDSFPDVVATTFSSVGVFLGNGSGGFSAPLYTSASAYPIAAGNIDGDGNLDLIVSTNGSGPGIQFLRGLGNGLFQNMGALPNSTVFPFHDLALKDVNLDGHLDAVGATMFSNGVYVALGNGTGAFTFKGHFLAASGGGSRHVALGDLNGDGRIDVVTADQSTNSVSVLLGDGTGGFALSGSFGSGSTGPSSVGIADFDGDSKADVVVSNRNTNVVGVLLGNGTGGLNPVVPFLSVGSGAKDVVVADFNNDTLPDVAVAYTNTNHVGVFLNISNNPPLANAGGPYSVNEGGAVLLSGSGSDPDGNPITFEWDLDGDNLFGEVGGARGNETLQNPTFSAIGLDGPSSYSIKVRTRDSRGAISSIATGLVTIVNVAPALSDVVVTTSINENGFATLTGNISDPGSLDSFILTVNWGEGMPQVYGLPPGSTSFSLSHQYLDDNPSSTASDIYNVSILSFTDDDGGAAGLVQGGNIFLTGHDILSHSTGASGYQNGFNIVVLDYLRGAGSPNAISRASYDVGVINVNSSFLPDPRVSATFGSLSTLNITASTTPAQVATFLASIDVLAVPEHNGSAAINLFNSFATQIEAYFNAGGDLFVDSSNGQANYYGFLPSVIGADGPGINQSTGFVATAAGTAIGITNSMINGFPTHNTFGSPDPVFTVFETHPQGIVSIGAQNVVIGGSSLSSALSVKVTNVAPTLSGLVATPILENGTTTLSGTIADVGTLDTFTVEIDWDNDGTYDETHKNVGAGSFSYKHQFLDDNPSGTAVDNMPINVRITDDDTGSVTGSVSVQVTNVAPTLSGLVATPILENGTTTLSGTIADVGTLDTFTVEIDWDNDGIFEESQKSVKAGLFSYKHQYLDDDPTGTAVDNMPIKVKITDDDGGVIASSHTVTSLNGDIADTDFNNATSPVFSTIVAGSITFSSAGIAHSHGGLVSVSVEVHNPFTNTWTQVHQVTLNSSGSFDYNGLQISFASQPIDQIRLSSSPGQNQTFHSWSNPSITVGTETAVTTVQVSNVAPVLSNVVVTPAINENGTAKISGWISDPGTLDTFGLQLDWGDPSSPNNLQTIPLGTSPISTSSVVWQPNQLAVVQFSGLTNGASGTIPSGTSFSGEIIFDVTQGNPGDPNSESYSYQSGKLSIGSSTVLFPSGGFSVENDGSFAGDRIVFNTGPVTIGGVNYTHGRLLELVDTTSQAIGSANLPFSTDLGKYNFERILFFGSGSDLLGQLNSLSLSRVSAFSITHQYLDDSPSSTASDPYTISAKVTDDDGGNSATLSQAVIVTNLAPTLSGLSATSIQENGTTTLSGTIADVGTLDTFTVEIDWDNDGTYDETHKNVGAGSFSYKHQFLDDNPSGTAVDNMPINVRITDDDTASVTGSVSVQVTNVAPTLSGLVATPILENGTTTLSGIIADVGTLDTFTVEIDWDNDGIYDETHKNLGAGLFSYKHQFLDDNPSGTAVDNMPINVRITDDDTASVTGSVSVQVTNVAPTLSGLVATPILENGTTTLSGTIADVGTLDTFTVEIDWDNDGIYDETHKNLGAGLFSYKHQFLDDNPSGTAVDNMPINVRITDDDTASVTGSVSVQVTNVAPTLSGLVATPILENGTTTLSGTIADVGTLDTFTVEIDWDNDGIFEESQKSVKAGLFSYKHQYLDDDPTGTAVDNMPIKVKITDDDGGVIASSHTVTSLNGDIADTDFNNATSPVFSTIVAGSITFSSAGIAHSHGGLVSVSVEVHNPFTNTWTQVHQVTLNSSGSFDYNGLQISFASQPIDQIRLSSSPGQNQTFHSWSNPSITVGTETAVTTVQVSNVAPTLNGLVATPILENGTTTLSGIIADVGTLDTFTVEIDWDNDGIYDETHKNLGAGSFSYKHQFLDDNPSGTAVDNMPINVRITDDDTASVTGSVSVQVTNVAPTLSGLVATPILENGTTTLSGTIADVGTLDTFTVEIDWDNDGIYDETHKNLGAGSFSYTHQFLDDNPSGTAVDNMPINVRITDDDTASVTGSVSVQVTNVAPTLSGLVATPILENGTTTLSGTIADVGTLDTFTVEIDWDNDGIYDETHKNVGAGSFSYTHQFLDDNPSGTAVDNMPINVRITDDDTASVTGSVSVQVTNVAPTLSGLVATPILENGTTTLSGTIADVGTLDTFTVEIDWDNDGIYDETHKNVGAGSFSYTHQFLDDNPSGTAVDNMPINVRITDDDTASVSGSVSVQVTNVAPTLSGLVATPILENGTTTLSGTIADVGTLDTFTVEIDWDNDGIFDESYSNVGAGSFSYTHQYLDDNPTGTPVDNMPIGLKVTDDDTGSVMGNVAVQVSNVNPSIDSLSVNSTFENGFVTLSGTYSDFGTQDSHTLTINWGEGLLQTVVVTGGVFTVQHQYLDDNPSGTSSDTYAISVLLTDDDGGTDLDSSTTTITNVAPTVVVSLSDASIDEGGTTTLSGSISDIGSLDTFTLNLQWGDPLSPANTQSFSLGASALTAAVDGIDWNPITRQFSVAHQYLDDNPTASSSDIYAITVEVVDDDSESGSAGTQVTVNNVAPTLSVSQSSIIQDDCHTTFQVAGTFSDPGADSYKVVIAWGDGSTTEYTVFTHPGPEGDGLSGTFNVSGSHDYTAFGNYTISVSVMDDDGGSDVEIAGSVTVAATAAIISDPVWGTTLDIHGTDLDDHITVNENMENGVRVYKVHSNSWATPRTYPVAGVNMIRVQLCDGDDHATISSAIDIGAILFGDAGMDHLNAGKKASTLLGGDGDDMLIGGNGNDILIGGLGADRIIGNGGDDILIGGRTSYDAIDAAWKSLMSVWNTNASNASRVAAVRNSANAYYLSHVDNGLLKPRTVYSDNSVDQITGSSGTDLFFAEFGDDALQDILTDLKGELALDSDQ